MQVLEWLNENQLRAYPLRNSGDRSIGVTTVDSIIVDAQLYTDEPNVYLESIAVDGDEVEFNLTGMQFVLDRSSVQYPAYLYSGNSLLVVSESAALLTVGRTFTDIEFEPTVCLELEGVYKGVSSLEFEQRIDNDEVVFNTTGPITGQIDLEGYYQVAVTLDGQELIVQMGRNAGVPIGCGNWFDETLSYDCGELVSNINGCTPVNQPGSLKLTAGSNIKIYNDPENHRIYIGLNFDTADICNDRPLPNYD